MPERTYTPRPFVYMGRRWDRFNRRVSDCVQPLNTEQAHDETTYTPHGEPMQFATSKRKLVLGGVYDGAEFDDGGAKGLSIAQYVGRWPDEAQRLEWAALDSQAETNAASAKLESDEKRRCEIEAILLPLRKLVHAKRHDPAAQQAIVNAVVRALHVAPRKEEE